MKHTLKNFTEALVTGTIDSQTSNDPLGLFWKPRDLTVSNNILFHITHYTDFLALQEAYDQSRINKQPAGKSAFEDQHRDNKPRLETRTAGDWIEEIQNPKHKLLARVQAAELAAANKKLRDFVPPGTRIEVRDYQNEAHREDHKLNKLERRALEYLISKEFLGKWDFTVSEYGEIVDGAGTVVLRAATVDAVKKALTYL